MGNGETLDSQNASNLPNGAHHEVDVSEPGDEEELPQDHFLVDLDARDVADVFRVRRPARVQAEEEEDGHGLAEGVVSGRRRKGRRGRRTEGKRVVRKEKKENKNRVKRKRKGLLKWIAFFLKQIEKHIVSWFSSSSGSGSGSGSTFCVVVACSLRFVVYETQYTTNHLLLVAKVGDHELRHQLAKEQSESPDEELGVAKHDVAGRVHDPREGQPHEENEGNAASESDGEGELGVVENGDDDVVNVGADGRDSGKGDDEEEGLVVLEASEHGRHREPPVGTDERREKVHQHGENDSFVRTVDDGQREFPRVAGEGRERRERRERR